MIKFLLIISFFLWFEMFSQNEVNRANHWYFSNNVALDFTCSPPPVSVGGGQVSFSEGSSTISDLSGNLLFYCNGQTVWDSTNTIMPNGTGLLGHYSTVQGSIIVPNPASPSKYYIFTAGTSIEDQGVIGVRFSEVDMSLNGGNGDVLPATKNTFLFAPNEEKLTAVRNVTRTGYWVVAQEKSTNRWYAYEVTAAGVNMTPVISTTGPPARVDNSLCAKFSPDGKWLASQNVCGSGASSNANLTVYQFNNATGQITYAWSDCGTPGFKLEFSNNSSKLYAAGFQVNQYDLAAGGGTGIGNDTTAVIASKTVISTSSWQIDGGLQLASDCKIYFSKGGASSLGVIHDPNLAGTACNLQTGYAPITSGSLMGSNNFPNFVQSFFEYPCSDSIEVEILASDTIICSGDSVVLEAIVTDLCGYTLTWNVPLTGLGPHTVYPTTTTTYQVIATTATAADTAEVTIVVGGQSAGADTAWSICSNSNYNLDTLLTSSANAGGSWYNSSYSAIAMPVNISASGANIFYYIIGSASCGDTAIYTITKSSALSNNILGNDTTLCADSLLLVASTPNSSYLWNDLSINSTLNVLSSGLYWVEVTDNTSGCSVRDSIQVTISSNAFAGRDSSVLVCSGTTIDLFNYIGGSPSAIGNWLDPSNNSVSMPLNIAIAISGNYKYIVGSSPCIDTAIILFTNNNTSTISVLGNDTTLCETDSYTISLNYPNASYLWNSGSISNAETINSPNTLYWVEITDTVSTCFIRDSLNINYSPAANSGIDSSISICGDTILDLYMLLGGTPNAGGNWFYPNGTSASMPIDFSVDPGGSYSYETQSGVCRDTAYVTVTIFSSGTLNLGNDTILCSNDSIVLDATTPNVTYNWNTGNTQPTQVIKNPGGTFSVEITDIISGCSVSDTINVSYSSALSAGLDSSIVLCSSNQIDLFNYLGGNPSIGGSWYTSSGSPITMPFDPVNGNFYYIIGNSNCLDTAVVSIQINTSNNQLSYYPLKPFAGETDVYFSNSNNSIVNWFVDSVNVTAGTGFNYVFPSVGTYEVCMVDNLNNCLDTVCENVQIYSNTYIYVPSTFSPNRDGFNEVFLPSVSGDLDEYTFYIFNRWGELIFKTDKTNVGWDGTHKNELSQLGIYTWRIKYKKTTEVDIKYMMGHVNLIR